MISGNGGILWTIISCKNNESPGKTFRTSLKKNTKRLLLLKTTHGRVSFSSAASSSDGENTAVNPFRGEAPGVGEESFSVAGIIGSEPYDDEMQYQGTPLLARESACELGHRDDEPDKP